MPQLELVRLAAVQGGEAGQEMDELARRRWWRPGGLQLVPAPQGGRAGGRHGGHDVGGARRGVSRVPLARGGRQGAVAGFHGRAQPRVALHGQAVHVGVEGAVGRAGVAVVLRALGGLGLCERCVRIHCTGSGGQPGWFSFPGSVVGHWMVQSCLERLPPATEHTQSHAGDAL